MRTWLAGIAVAAWSASCSKEDATPTVETPAPLPAFNLSATLQGTCAASVEVFHLPAKRALTSCTEYRDLDDDALAAVRLGCKGAWSDGACAKAEAAYPDQRAYLEGVCARSVGDLGVSYQYGYVLPDSYCFAGSVVCDLGRFERTCGETVGVFAAASPEASAPARYTGNYTSGDLALAIRSCSQIEGASFSEWQTFRRQKPGSVWIQSKAMWNSGALCGEGVGCRLPLASGGVQTDYVYDTGVMTQTPYPPDPEEMRPGCEARGGTMVGAPAPE